MSKHLSALLVSVLFLACTSQVQGQIVISTIAGQPPTLGYSGDEGPATDALLNNPSDIVLDHTGNIYFTDFINNVIRKIDTNGVIHNVAGTGFGAGTMNSGGYTGDGGPATAAELNGPFALTFDAAGNLVFADGYNHVVRKISTAGVITTIAGNHSIGYHGDNGPATAASINNPVGVAYDKYGNLYIADDHNAVIRKVSSDGIISTYAGNHIVGYSGDGGAATNASLGSPIGVAVDTAGNLYIGDSGNVVRKVTPLGIISTFAGTGIAGYSGDGGPATAATLRQPERITVDNANNVYISDLVNDAVRVVNAAGVISTFAGDGTGINAFGGDDGPATSAQLFSPEGVAVSPSGIVFISDRGNCGIRRVGPMIVDLSGISAVGNNSSALTVYPNPSIGGQVSYKLTSLANENAVISVVNVLGEVVSRAAGATNRTATIQANLPAGIYFLNAATTHGKWTKQIEIQ